MSSNNTLNELKTSSFDRRMSIAKTSINIGRRWASSSVGNLFVDKETREVRKQALLSEQATYLATELGKLKGSVVKVGQMMALYGEHLFPEEITLALHSLNDNTAVLSWQVIQNTLKEQLGDKLDELVVQTLPIGTASLAQVHRAVIKKTGEQVVLKVQYPGVADAIDSDLSLFTNLLKLSNAVPQTRAFDSWVEEIRGLLHREVDYALEAQTTQAFAERLSGDARFVVPKINSRFCTSRVICMSYETGVPINDSSLQSLSQQRRNRIGESAVELILNEIFTWGEMQTDPNFGNYLIRPAETESEIDKLVLLDFGAIRQFDDNLLHIAQGLLSAGCKQDKTAMAEAMKSSHYDFFVNMSEQVSSDMAEVFLLATEPFYYNEQQPNLNQTVIATHCLNESGQYQWGSSELHARLVARAKSAMQSVEFSIPPKEFIFISRKFIGAYTLLTVLDAQTQAEHFIKFLAR